MDWLTFKNFIYAWEPFAALFIMIISFSLGIFGGKLQQRYREGAIKGEIDTKFANAGRRIEELVNQLEILEMSLEKLWAAFKACQLVQTERVETRRLASQAFIKQTIDEEFAQFRRELEKCRKEARDEKQKELAELKEYINSMLRPIQKERKEKKWTFLKGLWTK